VELAEELVEEDAGREPEPALSGRHRVDRTAPSDGLSAPPPADTPVSTAQADARGDRPADAGADPSDSARRAGDPPRERS
jgi:hypothetical protein